MKVKYSDNYKAKMSRIRRLPELMNDVMMGALKKDARGLINEFQQGIINNDLSLEPLKPETISGKRTAGYKKPENPLYGKGEQEKDKSYQNMLRIRKLKGGWKVYVSKAMHWSGKISLKDLFTVHEYGTKVVRKDGTIIIIPPRPVFLLAYRRWMAKRKNDKKEQSQEVKKAIMGYIVKGSYGRFRTFIGKGKDKDEE